MRVIWLTRPCGCPVPVDPLDLHQIDWDQGNYSLMLRGRDGVHFVKFVTVRETLGEIVRKIVAMNSSQGGIRVVSDRTQAAA